MCSGGARPLILYGRAVNRSDTDGDRWRRIASRLLVALASLAILLALVAAYARQATVDSDQFANRATAALQDQSVRSLIAREDHRRGGAEERGRPGRRAPDHRVRGVRDRGRARVHGACSERRCATSTAPSSSATRTRSRSRSPTSARCSPRPSRRCAPALAERLQSTERVEVVRENIGSLSATLGDIAERVRILAILLILVSLGFVARRAARLARPARHGRSSSAWAPLPRAACSSSRYAIARSAVTNRLDTPEEQAAARAVWDAFLGDLRTAAWILAGAGAVLAAAAASLIKPLPFGASAQGRRRVARPGAPEPHRTGAPRARASSRRASSCS